MNNTQALSYTTVLRSTKACLAICIALIGSTASGEKEETGQTQQTQQTQQTGVISELSYPEPFGVVSVGEHLLLTSVDQNTVDRVKIGALESEPEAVPLAGSEKLGYAGDGGLATGAELNWPHEVRITGGGDLYVADTRNHVVRRIDSQTNRIETIAGDGTAGDSDTTAMRPLGRLNQPHSIVLLDDDHLLIADTMNHRIRVLDLTTNRLSTWCGTGKAEMPIDGGRRTEVSLNGPRSMAVDAGSVWIALREGNSIYRIDRESDQLALVAGTGDKGYSGDGGPAAEARLSGPKGLAIDDRGDVWISDTENHCIRKVDADGQIETVLGGSRSALTTTLKRPHGIDFDSETQTLWVADSENDRVLKIRVPLLK